MTKKKRFVPILIVIISLFLISGFIFIISNVIQQTGLESARGQTIWEDFNSNINPCPKIDVSCSQVNVENYAKNQFGENIKCAICGSGSGTVKNGELVLNSGSGDVELHIFEDLTGADISTYYTLEAFSVRVGTSYGSGSETISTSFGGVDSVAQTHNVVGSPQASAFQLGFIKIEHDFLDSTKGNVVIAGREENIVFNKNTFYLSASGSGEVRIDEIRYSKPYVGECTLNEGEVLVFKDFKVGSTIRWYEEKDNNGNIINPSTFTYEPLRFCFKEPARRVSVGEGIQYDDDAELTKKLSDGEEWLVRTGDFMRVSYITKFVEGMERDCLIGQAVNTDTLQCEKIVDEEAILLTCDETSDCPVPSACEGEDISCTGNACIGYTSARCRNAVLVFQEIIKYQDVKDIKPIVVREEEFIFITTKTDTVRRIGDQEMNINLVNNDIEVDFLGKTIIDSGEFNDFISIGCELKGSVFSNGTVRNDDYEIFCKVKITPFVDELETTNEFFYDLVGDVTYNFKINNLLNINFNNAGTKLNCHRITGLQESFNTELIDHEIQSGIKSYSLDIENRGKGTYVCEKSNLIRIFDDSLNQLKVMNVIRQSVFVHLNIGDEIESDVAYDPTQQPVVITEKEIIEKEVTVTESRLPSYFFPLIIILVVVIAGLVIFILRNRKKKKKKK